MFLFAILLVACAKQPYGNSKKSYKKQLNTYVRELKKQESKNGEAQFLPTVNFNLRKPNLVVIHHTAQNSCHETKTTFTRVQSEVSAHYVICKDGSVIQMLDERLRAWHAGEGSWGISHDVNSASIGIELDNDGNTPFPEEQIESLLSVLKGIDSRWQIPTANYIGHADLAPTRKNDPNIHFPWSTLAENGFGYFYDDNELIAAPSQFDPYLGLRVIGYGLQDTTATIRAFHRRFNNEEKSDTLTYKDKSIVFWLTQQ